MSLSSTSRILVIDNDDSFVHTLVSYLTELGAEVTLIPARDVADAIELIAPFDGIMISPGPGTPAEADGSLRVLRAAMQIALPVLGVCLGHQALGLVSGSDIVRGVEPMHGRASLTTHTQDGIFAGLPEPLTVGRYHSLVIDPEAVGDELEVTAVAEDGAIMAVRHRTLPFHGVQFHPESVLTTGGSRMLANWLAETGDTGALGRVRSHYARGDYSAAAQ